jgi:hypothetical protein
MMTKSNMAPAAMTAFCSPLAGVVTVSGVADAVSACAGWLASTFAAKQASTTSRISTPAISSGGIYLNSKAFRSLASP